LTFSDRYPGVLGKEDIKTRTESYEPESLSGLDAVTFPCPADNSSGNEPCYLGYHDSPRIDGLKDDAVPFVLLGCLVKVRRKKPARTVLDILDDSRNGNTVDMDIKEAHENTDEDTGFPQGRLCFAKVSDVNDPSVCGGQGCSGVA